ncbi:MAG TPA: methyltransferase domain-containing protein [Syntrophomonadaceae bacterium]|nr:methyltransferase domain-containing protein [Syntrophomonadaceae bacterium]
MNKEKTWEEYTEEDILEANIEKYSSDVIVKFYEDLEEPKYLYSEYKVILNAATKILTPYCNKSIRAVDMCGGAGKAAFAFKECSPNSIVDLVDVSEKMLEIAEDKALKQNIKGINSIQADAFAFLEQEQEQEQKYDLIMFSSAIHHFKDPVDLIKLASKRLSEHGLIVTIADPTTITKTKRYKFFEFLATNSDGKKNKLKSIFSFNQNKELASALDPDFDLAEYQTYTGIDDIILRADLKEIGLNPLIHIRYPAGEPYMTKIMPYLGLCWAFSMIISKNIINEFAIQEKDIKEKIVKEMPFKFKFMC